MRLLSLLLVLAMLFTFLPSIAKPVFAEAATESPSGLLVLGDSIARGYGLKTPEARFGDLLANEFGIDSKSYSNRAVDGATSGDLVSTVKAGEYDAFISSGATIVISIGGNDVLGLFFSLAKTALGLPPNASNEQLQEKFMETPNALLQIAAALVSNQARFMQNAESFRDNLDTIIDCILDVRNSSPYADMGASQLYVLTIYNPFDGIAGFEMLSAAADVIISTMNDTIMNHEGFTYVDVYEDFKGNALEYTNMQSIDIHPNTSGHRVIADAIAARMSEEVGENGGGSGDSGASAGSALTGNPFVDVRESYWFYDEVMFVFERGLMLGTESDRFSPNAPMTRGMIVTILYRLAGEPNSESGIRNSELTGDNNTPNSSLLTPNFSDIVADAYYYDAVLWAAENGIVSGYGDGRFGPNDNITREQAAAIIYNYAVFAGAGPQGTWAIHLDFEDVADISDWAISGAMFCYMKGIINGKPGNLFDPKAGATRAEFAAILMRFS